MSEQQRGFRHLFLRRVRDPVEVVGNVSKDVEVTETSKGVPVSLIYREKKGER